MKAYHPQLLGSQPLAPGIHPLPTSTWLLWSLVLPRRLVHQMNCPVWALPEVEPLLRTELCLSPLCVELGRCRHISFQVKLPPFSRKG